MEIAIIAMSNKKADEGNLFVCLACGKTSGV
jgi:hypothetical protein